MQDRGAQGPPISLRSHRTARHYFRCGVARSAGHQSGRRQPVISIPDRDTEVDEHGAAFGQNDVRRFDVTVNHPCPVDTFEDTVQCCGQARHFAQFHCPAADARGEGWAVHVFGDNEGFGGFRFNIEDAHDAV